MRFIRKHGRIIPIREDQDHSVKRGLQVGAAVAVTSQVPIRGNDKRVEVIRRIARRREFLLGSHYPVSIQAAKNVGDKARFARNFPGTIPTRTATEAALAKLAGKPFVIKPKADAMQTMADFVTDQSPRVPKRVLQGGHLIQPRLDFSAEYRVTTAAGRVTSITHRRLAGQGAIGAFIPVARGRDEISRFVERSLAAHPSGVRSGILGVDVGRTAKGLKMIEANISPGDLLNPIKSLKAHTYLMGKLPLPVGLGLGALAGFATYRYLRPEGKK